MKARALLIWWVLWSSPVWLGAGTVELLTADAELRLEAARAMAHNVVATEPTSSTAIAAAAWWIERVEFLAEPAALAELVHPPADPELTYLVAQVDASVHNRTPAMVLRRADLSGPFGAFDTLDLARWTMPADRELPPLPTPWSSESEPFRLAAERMDGWIVPPPAMLRPGVYLASWPLRVPEEWSGWLVVEAEGSFELEADGRLVDHQQRCGELAAAVHWYRARLTAGVHRLRVAFASPRTPRVRLSLLDDDARPAAHLVDTQLSGAAIGTGAVVTPASPPARAALEGRLAADDAFLGDLLAAVLLARSRRDGVSEGELLDRAARVAARTDHGPLVDLQRVTWRLQSWTGDDPGTNQRAARGLLAEADGLPLARVFRRVLNLRQQRYEDADNDLDQLIEDAGHDPRVISMWLDHALNNGWAAEAEATLDRLVYAIPESPALVDRRLDVLKTLDRFEDTAQVLEELASADPWYPGLVEELAVSCRPDLALAVLQQREKTGVVDFATDMGRLQLLTETGETAAAENQLQACRHRWGQLPVLDRYALELSASEGDEAVLQAARAAVERSPHQMELWELLWRLGEEPFFTPFEVDALELATAFEGGDSDIDSILILDQAVERVFADGSSLYYYHGLSRAVTPAGARQAAELPLLPDSVLLSVRVIRPDGSVIVPANVHASDPGVRLEDVEPGDMVEQRYVAPVPPARATRTGHLSPYIYRFAASDRAFGLSEYVLVTDPGMELHFDGNLDGVDREEQVTDAGLRVVRFATDQVAPIPDEPFAPPEQELLPWVTYGFGVSWQDVGDSIRDRVLETTVGSPQLWAWADSLLTGANEPRQELQRLMTDLVERIDRGDAALTFAATAGESFAAGEGNRLAIAACALERGGWEVDLVLTRPLAMAGSHLAVPTLDAFGLTVLRVVRDGQELWLDVEEEAHGVDRLRAVVQGSDGLLLPLSDPTEPVRLVSSLPTFANPGLREHVRLEATLSEDGSARATLGLRLSGGSGDRLAQAVRSAPTDRETMIYERLAGSFFPGVEGVSGALEESGADTTLELSGVVPAACEQLDGKLSCRRLVLPQALAPRLATLPERRFPLVLQLPILRTWEVELEVGFELELVSSPRRFETRWGTVVEEREVDGTTVRSTLRLDIPAQVVAPEQYQEFARFCHAVDELLLRPLLLRRVEQES